MDIIRTLKHEESNLQRQLKAVQGAISALNGATKSIPSVAHTSTPNGRRGKSRRRMSAAARARISRATKARWAKYRAEMSKKAK